MSLQVLEELKAIGVEVIPHGDNLVIRPASKVPPELKERLKAAKPEIIALLSRPATCSPFCYEIEPGRWVHHPWDGCKSRPVVSVKAAAVVDVHCWHCGGKKSCSCISCWDAVRDRAGACLICRGTGVMPGWIQ